MRPYTDSDDDRARFFGREQDQEIIIANLYAASLTVFYGASGVGKSSVLLAGVVPELRQTPRFACVIFHTWQSEKVLPSLKVAILGAVQAAAKKEIEVDPALPLDDFLLQCTQALRGHVVLIFDQFEEYFLYHAASAVSEGFDAEFARSVNRSEIDASFLLSMREDSLSKLDRFQGRIPKLLTNLLRLDHLGRDAAIRAIREPLAACNKRLPPGAQPSSIDDDLVEALLDQVKTGTDLFNLPPERRSKLTIGIHDRSPASTWLVKHGFEAQAKPYPMLSPDPDQYPGELIEKDLAQGTIDAAIVWGPIAGYYARRVRNVELVVVPLKSEPGVKFDYEIAMGVRYGEREWKETIDKLIVENRSAITAILRDFRVPLLNEHGETIE